MQEAHHETLVGGDLGRVTLLYVDDKLVGSMKMYRDRSIIGLRTVEDSEGRLPLVTGGVYVTTHEITRQAEEAFKEQGKWAKLYLDKLPLFPMEFAWINWVSADSQFEKINQYVEVLKGVRERLEG